MPFTYAVPAPAPTRSGDPVQRADQLTVVHHDDTISHFADVTYTLARAGLHVIGADGTETVIARHEILTTHVVLTNRSGRGELLAA
jgi:hypothetical protein